MNRGKIGYDVILVSNDANGKDEEGMVGKITRVDDVTVGIAAIDPDTGAISIFNGVFHASDTVAGDPHGLCWYLLGEYHTKEDLAALAAKADAEFHVEQTDDSLSAPVQPLS